MSTPLSVQQWLADLSLPLLFIGLGILIGFTALYLSAQRRRSSLVRDRSGRTVETFAEYLAEYGFDPELARATYRHLQKRQKAAFPIDPFDDLDCDLGLDSEELRETIRGLLAETGRIYLPGLLDSPLVTVWTWCGRYRRPCGGRRWWPKLRGQRRLSGGWNGEAQ
jgi:hypothetical protein